MDLVLYLTILAFIAGFFFYLASKIDALSTGLNSKMDGMRDDIAKEMKDFHGRLCSIEERRKRG